jgi:hypothetical protein
MKATAPVIAALTAMTALAGPLACTHTDYPRRFEHNSAGGPPMRAIDVDTGRSTHLSWEASGDGVIYVYDTDLEVIVYEGLIRKGQTIGVDASMDKITINGEALPLTRLTRDMIPGDRHRIEFLGEGQ